MNYYLFLYGVGRDLSNVKSTIEFFKSIESDIHVVYHYLRIENISNPRTNESGRISYDGIEEVTEDTKEIRINSDIKIALFNYSMEFEDGHNDNYKSNDNLLNQLLILDSFSDLLSELDQDDIIVAFRDDIKFDKLSTYILKYRWRKIIKSDKIFVSAFSWHGGINDKFFISNKINAEKLLSRINYVRDSITHYQHLNAEELILYVIDKMNLTVVPLFCRVGRVRINGVVKWDPFFPSITRIKDIFRVIKNL